MLEQLAGSPALFIGTCLVLGLLVGSFLNVVIHRLPIMLRRQWREQCAELAQEEAELAGDKTASSPQGSGRKTPAAVATSAAASPPAARPERFNLIVPRSACPACKAPIGALQNIPLLSYLWLKGRCASCGVRISVRYPIVELLTGLISAAVAWKFGFGWPALGALVLSWFLIALTFIDIDHQLLPDNLTLPLVWLGILASFWAGSAAAASGFPADLRSSVIGAVAGYLSLWSVYHVFRLLTGKEGMGYGDFKLFAALGAWLGWQMLLPLILIAAAVGAIVGIALIVAQGRSRATPIPFGPFLAAAGWLMLMFGPALVQSYLGSFAARP